MLNANKEVKWNRFEQKKFHIPYYTASYFDSGKEDGDGNEKAKTASVKIPVRINNGEGESRSNVTSFSVRTIKHFDNDVEGVLTSLSFLDKRVIKPKGIKDSC